MTRRPSSWQLVRERALAAEGGPSLWNSWFSRLTGACAQPVRWPRWRWS